MIDLGSLWSGGARLVMVAVRSFVGTVLVLAAAGAVLAVCSFLILKGTPTYALIGAAVALLESLATGVVLGGKRAFIMALAHGLSTLRLGRTTVRILFGRVLGIADGNEFGARGGAIARALERIPLAQAEERLNTAVNGMVRAQPTGGGVPGWLRRKLQSKLLRFTHKYTLSRFREQDVQEGGVDLVKMQAELEELIDVRLVAKLRSGLNIWTVIVILGLPSAVFAQTYIALALLK
jgi:hypothetical protein